MTQRSKNIALILAFIVMLIVSYKLSISETVSSYKSVEELRIQAENSKTIGSRFNSLKRQEAYFDSILGANQIKSNSTQNNLLDFLNSQSEKKSFSITTFNEPHIIKNDLSKISSYSFKLSGSFNDILSVIYSLEQEYNFGKVSHLDFEKKKDYRKNRNYLECFVIIEGLDLE